MADGGDDLKTLFLLALLGLTVPTLAQFTPGQPPGYTPGTHRDRVASKAKAKRIPGAPVRRSPMQRREQREFEMRRGPVK